MNTIDQSEFPDTSYQDIQFFLQNYELMVKTLPELAESWSGMDDFERLHARTVYFDEGWGPRELLGTLYRTGRLTPDQETQLAALDTELVHHLDEATLCYDLGMQDIARLFTWGSPLTRSNQILHIPIRPRALQRLLHRASKETIEHAAGAWQESDHPELATPTGIDRWIEEGRAALDWDRPLRDSASDRE